MTKAFDKTNRDIDAVVRSLREQDCLLQAKFIDQVFRPYCHLLVDTQQAGRTEPEAVALDLATLVSTMFVELASRGCVDGDTAVAFGNMFIVDLATKISESLPNNFVFMENGDAEGQDKAAEGNSGGTASQH